MTHKIHARQVFAYIFQMLRPYKFAMSIMVLTAISWSVHMSLQPYILKVIIDRISEASGESMTSRLFGPACAFIILSIVMMSIFRLYGYFVDIKMIPSLRTKIGSHAFDRLTEQSNKFYQNNFAGSLANKIGDLTSAVPELLQTFMDKFVAHGLGLGLAIFTLLQVNIKFAITNVIWCMLFIIASFFFSRRISRLSAAYSEIGSMLTGKYVDVFSNILSVRLFARKPFEMWAINAAFDEAVATERKLEWFYFWMWCGTSYSIAKAL